MNDLASLVDWSRAQFALTAMYHWLFVPLTIGLSLIVAIMETMWYRTKDVRWKNITKFWMTLFGINFACGIATGIILEFEFGTNWSNYSWFVGDIFGAPLAIEGIVAFFMEATFVAVMFFGWNKVSRGFHLASTWLVAIGVTLSALWILIANAWMQYPVGMEFDPSQMRNVMDDFLAVALSPVAINKFFHTVTSGWVLAACFVVGISCWLMWRGRNNAMARKSVKIASWVGLAGIVLCIYTGDTSAVEISRVQPMKLAAMEGLYNGSCGQSLVGLAVLNPEYKVGNNDEKASPYLFDIAIPKGLSILAKHDANAFVPGINDIIAGIELTPDGDTVSTVSYAERIEIGQRAQAALRDYDAAVKTGDKDAEKAALKTIKENYEYFGYGFLSQPEDAVPPVAITFYAFRVMVIAGGFLLLLFVVLLFVSYKKVSLLEKWWMLLAGMVSIPVVWVCSQSGWVVAEVGRQPWVIQDKLPTTVAISDIPTQSVQVTFWIFAAVFTLLLIAEISIMLRYIGSKSKTDIENG